VPNRKTDRDRITRTVDSKPRSLWIVYRAGAIVAELMDDRKLNNDMGKREVHFRRVGQFLGFSGSSGPSHVTYGI
jgi:hypothetical protein